MFRQPPILDQAHAGGPESGFTLLETLTALTIMAIALTSLFEANTLALRTAGTADDFARARILGDSLLAEASGGMLATSSRTGTEGRYTWRVDVSPARGPWAAIKSEKQWRLFQLHATVAWEGGRQIDLDTLKLAGGTQ